MVYKFCSECGTSDKDPRCPKCRHCHLAEVAESKARREERERRQQADLVRRQKEDEAKRIADAAAYDEERKTCYICLGKPLGGVPLPADAETPTFCRVHKHSYSFARSCNLCHNTVRCVAGIVRGIVCYSCGTSASAAQNYAIWPEEDRFNSLPDDRKRYVVPGVYMQFCYLDKTVQTYLPRWLVPFVGHTNEIYPTRMFDRNGNTNTLVEGALVEIFTSLYAVNPYTEGSFLEMMGTIKVIRGVPGRLPFEEMMTSV